MHCIPLIILFFSTTAWAQREFKSTPWYDEGDFMWRNKDERMREYTMWLKKKFGIEDSQENIDTDPSPPLYRHRPQKQFTYEIPVLLPGGGSSFASPPTDERFFTPDLNPQPQKIEPVYEDPPITSKKYEEEDLEPNVVVPDFLQESQVVKSKLIDFDNDKDNIVITALIAGTSAAALAALALLVYGYVRLQKKAKAAADVEYPAYGVTGPNKDSTPTGDRRLAHSAQVYHYQLTKQQIIAMEGNRGERRGSISEADSDDDNEEGDYTVYECPGLAPTGEMEVKNPMFQDDPTPATTAENDQDDPKTQTSNK
ncbi:protein cab-1 [Cimex lectularius]|uniref:Neural proliferation differentiation and control protein n=1 Tax=Cimex lectularius TaxID=79782 RepID=A0A8I6RLI2_CIMLE|nr:protein cab-1 [Cimex lectularius]